MKFPQARGNAALALKHDAAVVSDMSTPCDDGNCWAFSSPRALAVLLSGRRSFTERDVPEITGTWAQNRARALRTKVNDPTGALYEYSDGNQQMPLNGLLREGSQMPPDLASLDHRIETLFDSTGATVTAEFTVFRGIKGLDGEPVWLDRAYASCSTSPYSALAFATGAKYRHGQTDIRSPRWALLWINVLPGAKAISSRDASKYLGEEEVLLPKRAGLRPLADPVQLGGGMIYLAVHK